jgi:DNA-binding transcriptional MerR regulator
MTTSKYPNQSYKEYLSTTDVCREAKVTRGQLRLYERDGLLKPPTRSAAGYRKYHREVIDRLKAINGLKELGLTLGEIAGLLSERDFIGLDASKLQQKASDMLLKTDLRIARLNVVRSYLEKCISGDQEIINDPDCKFMTDFLCAGSSK